MKRVRVLISGQVQGVFFRAWIAKKAQSLGLTGWVRNTPEGKVEAVFEPSALRQAQGSPRPELGTKAGREGRKKIEEMIKFCHQGPPLAKVENVEVKWSQGIGEFTGFEIRYY